MRAPALLLLLTPGLAPLANAQTFTFTPVEDAPAKHYASSSTHPGDELAVRWYPHSARNKFARSFLRFDVSGIDGVAVNSLHLQLTEGDDGSAGDVAFEVRDVSGTAVWDENGLTWDDMPSGVGRAVGFWDGTGLSEGGTLTLPLDVDVLRDGDGTYDLVLLEVWDGGMQECFFESREGSAPPELIVNGAGLPLHSAFYVKQPEGAVPFAVTFENLSTRSATSWLWDFGDGTTSTGTVPVHTYATPGRYDVTLTATDASGSVTTTRPGYIFAHPADGLPGTVRSTRKLSHISDAASPDLEDQDMFGRSCALIGDLDSDGNPDLIVGAVGTDDSAEGGEDMPGGAWILFLNANGSIRASQKISETAGGFTGSLDANDGFGRVVAGIGDLDGDGVLDVAVGANYDDDLDTRTGAVYILFLNTDGTVRDHQKISALEGWTNPPIEKQDQFGRGIANLGDMDGDGVQDLAVGATGDDDGGGSVGAVYVLFMNSDGTVKDHAKISATSGGITSQMETSSSLWFGMSVASLGDVNGDGVTDIAVGALLDDAIYHACGAAYVLLLNADGTVQSDHYIGAFSGDFDGELQEGDEFGGAVAGPGDLNLDGVPDLVVGSIRDDDNATGDTEIDFDRGAAYVFFLNADGTVQGMQKLSDTRGGFDASVTNNDRIGESLGYLGDLDGDGRNDLLLGTRFDDDGGLNRGAVYICYMNDGSPEVPAAAFDQDVYNGPAPLTVAFEDASSGSQAVAWAWDFGDGSTSTEASPTHTYLVDGTYSVSLTVTDALGQTDSTTQPGAVLVLSDVGVVPYGCGVNPAGSFTLLSGAPVIGTGLTFGVDNPLGTQPAGSLGAIVVSFDPDLNFPCGTPLTNFGMAGGAGELLVSLLPPNPVRMLQGGVWNGPGTYSQVSLALPNNSAFIGTAIYVQGYMIDVTASSGRVKLAGALELTMR